MPRCCSISGCKSNYASNPDKVSTFSLPKSEPARSLWLQSIPTDLSHIQNPIICIKHFEDRAIVRIDKSRVRGKVVKYPRVYPKLAAGAIPSVFPTLTSQSEPWNLPHQSTIEIKNSVLDEKNSIDPLTVRRLLGLMEINKYIREIKHCIRKEWAVMECPEKTVLCFMFLGDIPSVLGSISVNIELGLSLHLNHERLQTPKDMMSLQSVHDLLTIIELVEKKIIERFSPPIKYREAFPARTSQIRQKPYNVAKSILGHHIETIESKEVFEMNSHNYISDLEDHCPSSSPAIFEVKKEIEEPLALSLTESNSELGLVENLLGEDIKPSLLKSKKYESELRSQECLSDFLLNESDKYYNVNLMKNEKIDNQESTTEKETTIHHDTLMVREKKFFVCDQCTFTTDRKSTLNRHKFYHTGEKPFSCDECTYKCSRKSTLKTHMLIHTGEKQFACDLCSYTCSANGYLKRHKLTHTGEKSLACDQCGFVCNRLYNLKIHKRQHTGEKPFSCDKCSFTCSQSSNLKNHKLKHTDEKPYACEQCSFTCHYLYHLKMHQLKHTGEKPYLCDQCSYSCRQKGNFDRHLLKHTGEKPFSCDQCDFKCSDKGNLKRHRFKHTGQKPYSCDQCGFVCSEKSYLNRHKFKHAAKKPFACNQCTFQCSRSNVLKHHKYTHTGEKPFSCDQCSFVCTIMNVLTRHKLLQHT